jgi:hypothetical protein
MSEIINNEEQCCGTEVIKQEDCCKNDSGNSSLI